MQPKYLRTSSTAVATSVGSRTVPGKADEETKVASAVLASEIRWEEVLGVCQDACQLRLHAVLNIALMKTVNIS